MMYMFIIWIVVIISQMYTYITTTLYILNMCCLLYVSYIYIKLLKCLKKTT